MVDGMRRQLVSSAHAGESVTRVAERLLDIDKPIVRLPQHVQELRDAAQMALHRGDRNIYLDAVKKWQGTVERLGQGPEGGAGAHTMRSATQQLVKDLGVAKADQLDHVVDRWVVERARHQARVIARTETVEAFRDVYKETTAKQPYVVGYRWQLSGGHPRADECDVYAGQDVDGLGPGGYLPESVPSSPHPHDLCAQVAIVDKDYFKRELAKNNGTEEPPKPWESGKTELGATWLKKQPDALQKQVLGPTLHRLFTAGRNVLDAQGKPLPVHVVLGRDKPVRRLGQKIDATGAIARDRQGQVKPFPQVGAPQERRKPTRKPQPVAVAPKQPAQQVAKAQKARALSLKQLEQTPDHWLSTEFEAKYGAEVGRAVAWGKAVEYRGRAASFTDARRELDELAAAGVQLPKRKGNSPLGIAQNRYQGARPFKTLGEAIEHYEGAGADPSLVRQLRASAALVGHRRAIKKREVPVELAPPKLLPDARMTADQATQVLTRTRKVYETLGDASLVHPGRNTYDFVSDAEGRGFHERPTRLLRGQINMGEGTAKVVAHEWGHALEHLNPNVYARARAYVERRTAGEAEQRLSVLLKDERYGFEMAKPDKLFHPYAGKLYPSATEMTSMLTQKLLESEDALEQVLESDPDSFHFLFGQLKGDQ